MLILHDFGGLHNLFSTTAEVNRKSWYIWFSIAAFFGLIWDTQSKIDPNYYFPKAFAMPSKLVRAFNRHFFFSFVVILMLPHLIVNFLIHPMVQEVSAWSDILSDVQIVLFYLQGVYITYRLYKWREKNLPKEDNLPEKPKNDLQ